MNSSRCGLVLAIFTVSAVSLVGCSTPSAGSATTEFINGCADSDLSSKSILYFGPSNQIGPGSVWSRLGPSGGYQPQWRLQDLGVDGSVIQKGLTFQCDLSQNSKIAANGGLSVVSLATNASSEAKQDFSRGKILKVTTKGAAWDTVIAGPYGTRLKDIADASVRADVMGTNRIVLRRALRLEGYKVTLDFDSKIRSEIQAKYKGKLGKETLGEVGANLSATWTEDGKLELTASDSIYVAGEFAQLIGSEWVATKGGAGAQDLGETWIKPFVPKH